MQHGFAKEPTVTKHGEQQNKGKARQGVGRRLMPRPTLDAPASVSNTLNSLLATNRGQKDSKKYENAWEHAIRHARAMGLDNLPFDGLERRFHLACQRC